MNLRRAVITLACPLLLALCGCAPTVAPQARPGKVLLFGTFSGTENGADVLRTPAAEFGWFAREVTLQFYDHLADDVAVPKITVAVHKSGYFSSIVPASGYGINVQMPNRRVSLEHAITATEPGKAYYLGHLHLDITRRNLFLVLCVCSYGTIDNLSFEDRLDSDLRWLEAEQGRERRREIVKSLPVPIEGSHPSVGVDCGCLR